MAKEIKIGIEADYSNFMEGNNKVVDGLSTLRNTYIKTGQGADDYSTEIENQLKILAREGDTLDSLTKSYNLLSKEAASLSAHLGQDDKQFQLIAKHAQNYALVIQSIQRENQRAAEAAAERKRIEEESAVKEQELAAIFLAQEKNLASLMDEVNKEYQERAALLEKLNQKNTNVAFMVATGDEVGVANYALKEYEQTLKNTIAETGLNSEATKQATEAYMQQKAVVDGLTASQNQMGSAVHGSGLKLLTIAKNILKFQLLMIPIRKSINFVTSTIKDSVKVAAEAEQIYSKLATVFDGLADSAKSAAASISGNLGVANSTAASALSTVGDLLQAQGMGTSESLSKATEWVQMFNDIIAFKDINMTLNEFAQNFMSGAAGNLRNFRTFGSIVKESAVNARLAAQGYDSLTGSELELAKMTARANIALEQQKNAMGATEREWNTMLSVNRRLNESWKEYKENLGNTLNLFVKPIKSWLAEILDYTNDVTRALKEINGGEFTVKVEQESSDKFIRMVGTVLASQMPVQNMPQSMGFWDRLNEAIGLSSGATMNQIYSTGRITNEQLRDVMLSTGATKEQILLANDQTGLNITAEQADAAEALVKQYWAEKEALDSLRNSLISTAETADSFTDALGSLKGVNIAGTSLETDAKALELTMENKDAIGSGFNAIVDNAVSSMIQQVYDKVSGLGSDAFANLIDLAFGLNSTEEDYQAWLEEIKNLYTILANRQKTVGDVGEDVLERVIGLWGRVNDQMKEYVDGLERAKKFDEGVAGLQNNAASYSRQLQLVGLEGLDLQLKELELDFADLTASFTDLTEDELTTLTTEYDRQVDALRRLTDAQDAYAARVEAQNTVSGILSTATMSVEDRALTKQVMQGGLQTSNGQVWDMNSQQASFYVQFSKDMKNLSASLKSLEQTTNESGEIMYKVGESNYTLAEINAIMDEYLLDNLEALKDVTDEIKGWGALGESANPFSNYVDAFNSGKENTGSNWGGIVAILIELLKNTEAFKTVASLIQDTIVPILDAILRPLMPVIKLLQVFFDELPWEIIFDIMKVIALILGGTLYAIKAAINTISAIVKTIYYAVTFQWGKISETWDKYASEMKKDTEVTAKMLDEIRESTFHIERNTEKDDLATLKELYKAKIITEDQFYAGARVLQKDKIFDPVAPIPSSYITNNSPTSTSVNYGGVTVYFQGDNLEEAKRWFMEFLNEQGMSYNVAIGG